MTFCSSKQSLPAGYEDCFEEQNVNLRKIRWLPKVPTSGSRQVPADKLKAVRLRLEEGFRLEDVCAEIGVAQSGLSRWIRQYQEFGEAGLQNKMTGRRKDRLPAPNHQRPNQGIEGLCPADRFFEIQSELRKTIETGIQENLLELALRGKPQAPFYMVGRMDGQSVVLRAEKGKLKLSVSDQQNQEQELTYDLNQNSQRKEGTENTNASPASQRTGQSPGSAGGVDGTVQTVGSLPPIEHQLDHVQPLAAPGDGGDAASLGKPRQPDQGRSLESAPTGAAPKPASNSNGDQAHQPAGADKQTCQPRTDSGKNGVNEVFADSHQTQSQAKGGTDLQSPLRPDDGHRGGTDAGHLPPAVLPVGSAKRAQRLSPPRSPRLRLFRRSAMTNQKC
jgi:transposase-like protein